MCVCAWVRLCVCVISIPRWTSNKYQRGVLADVLVWSCLWGKPCPSATTSPRRQVFFMFFFLFHPYSSRTLGRWYTPMSIFLVAGSFTDSCVCCDLRQLKIVSYVCLHMCVCFQKDSLKGSPWQTKTIFTKTGAVCVCMCVCDSRLLEDESVTA